MWLNSVLSANYFTCDFDCIPYYINHRLNVLISMELNPIYTTIDDLSSRIDALRGYL